MPLQKVSMISIYGAPAVVGKINGFIVLCNKGKLFPNFTSHHCIIHHDALLGRILLFEYVMKIITKIALVQTLCNAPFSRPYYKIPEDSDLILHTEIR
ncbi:hypothetical protein NPIL_34191 [Nephila pilipes]|uniref:Uncharacterized protein n=1 Tax=Nephila pilipes TaxID=299642 RepID=A0A8X6QZV7_NEPPI|nr:hypothetical protein NPIL_34191 [Nephila pilipes]